MDHSWGYGSEQRLREENQDCFGVFELPHYTLAVVCDGMGGHVGGAQASALAVRTIHDTLLEMQGRDINEAMQAAIERTNLEIYEAARKNHRLMGMGTTVVVAVIANDTCFLAHVGDSRAYLVRRGQVQQLTRDHTMVNLFVDAELLSPEDAATHPEAHVLSRSLGVERQVEVEIAPPMQLEPGDIVFLCSDGVHGVVTDWELGGIEWGAPHQGVGHVLDIVGQRDGDDNATGVAVLMGTSFEDVPVTHLPELRRFDEVGPGTGAGVTAVPHEEDRTYDSGAPIEADANNYIVYNDQPQQVYQDYQDYQEPPPVAPHPPTQVAPPHDFSEGRQSHSATANLRKRSRMWLAVIPVVLAVALLVVALAGATVLLLPPSPTVELDDGMYVELEEDLSNGGGDFEVLGGPEDGARAGMGVEGSFAEAEAEPEPALPLFNPDLPPAPRRLPTRPQRYTQPPPGGPLQYEAVSAARRRDCPAASAAVQKGMRDVSIDHATLYRGAWLCFNEAHQRKLEQDESPTWDDFAYKLEHFEGTPEAMKQASDEDPKRRQFPRWYRDPVGGIEYRIKQFTEDEQMVDVLHDLFGEATIADHLAKDVHMEALAAVGLSRVPPAERTPALIDAWARRVYFTSWALRNRPGRSLDAHRQELVPTLRGLLDEATSSPEGKRWPVPKVIAQARAVGEGNAPPPRIYRKKRRVKSPEELLQEQIDNELKKSVTDQIKSHQLGGSRK